MKTGKLDPHSRARDRGSVTSFVGAYASFFLDGATGGVIICLQTALFLVSFVFAPKHGMLAARRRAAAAPPPR